MMNNSSKTIFSQTPRGSSQDSENGKISEWLEKLHAQGEKAREDDNRREEQSAINAGKRPEHEQVSDKNGQSQAQLGINAHARTAAAKSEADRQTVNDLVRKSNRRIISISSVFPWDLFPNTVDVEESRVTFRFSQFLSSQSHSVEIKDISNVFIESSLFFASLQVVSRTYIQNDIKIGKLSKKKAREVQRVIEGLRTFAMHDINTSDYEIDELVSKIGEFHIDHA